MKIQKFTVNPIQENTYFISDNENKTIIIDPGCYFKEEQQLFLEYIESNKLKIEAILNTHAHLDHIMGNSFLKNKFNVPIYLHRADLPTLSMSEQSAKLYGLNQFEPSPMPDIYVEEGDELQFGAIKVTVILGPGHAPGHVAFYCEEENWVMNGDILFRGSYGRVDLPGGNFQALKSTILDKMFKLPDNTLVYSGHGEETTIGEEKKNNPVLW